MLKKQELFRSGTVEQSRRTYWLSFVDRNRRAGERFLGVVVVDVSASDAAIEAEACPTMHDLVHGPWLAAAARQAWRAGVNPGGEIAAERVDEQPEAARYPRLQLMSQADLDTLGI